MNFLVADLVDEHLLLTSLRSGYEMMLIDGWSLHELSPAERTVLGLLG